MFFLSFVIIIPFTNPTLTTFPRFSKLYRRGSQGEIYPWQKLAEWRGWSLEAKVLRYCWAKPDTDAISLLHHVIDSGVTFLDTSDIYGPETNELLLGKVSFWNFPSLFCYFSKKWFSIVEISELCQALKNGLREKVELATKFGISNAEGKLEIN